MNHAGHLRFSLTHVHKKNHPFCVYEQNCCESKTRPCDSHAKQSPRDSLFNMLDWYFF